MNYRHVYHAGNFADVFKHAVLARIIIYLQRKDAEFRVIDTHAGTGLYHLSSEAAMKTGEWLDGIGRLREAKLSANAQALMQPYLDIALPMVAEKHAAYPGSPLIARRLFRKQDRLTAIELHPDDARQLAKQFAGDYQARIIELDGWLALGAHLPPKEKRGLVLIDPPFEEKGEFERMIDGVVKAHKRWPGGICALWYPMKKRTDVIRYRNALAASGVPNIIDAELSVRDSGSEKLDGCGMTIINPPFTLEAELRVILAALAPVLEMEPRTARWGVKRLVGEVEKEQ